ncbi:MAG: hypothetical protein J6C53_00145 [Clostridia bacterium]|nr:hypothetical protein [Clostridia bacterium]
MSNLLSFDSTIRTFFNQLTETLGFVGFLGILLGVELLFIIIFGIRAALSYEARLKRSLDKTNQWLFKTKVITEKNIKAFNESIKRGPKRLAYYWQQYILYREGAPSTYMTIENVVEKPIKTSSWAGSIKSLGIVTAVWSVFALILGLASQATNSWSFPYVAVALVLPCLVLLMGAIAIIVMKGMRTVNLDDIYHIYHLFARFVDNACADLPDYIDFDLLFTAKEIENGNPQLRQYYEERARKAKEEFENAKKNDIKYAEYNFKNVGVDGALLLDRAMKESEIYINKKTSTLASIAQAESQKEALRRNYENVQMDLQRKIQASKENIRKLIEQQAATTSRIEVGLLRQQQEKESKKQEALQKDYDTEETRYKSAKADLDKEVERLSKILVESLAEAERGMSAEYQTFFEKVMKSAYAVAEKKTDDEKKELKKQYDTTEQELINVQTQIKRLMDENLTLREKLAEYNPDFKTENQDANEGHYDENGNFIYADGSYHSPDGLFHDTDGKIYDMNGVEVTKEVVEQGTTVEQLQEAQIDQFGAFVPTDGGEMVTAEELFAEETPAEEKQEEVPAQETTETPAEEVKAEEVENQETAPAEEKPAEEVKEEVTETPTQAEEVKEDEKAPAKKRGRPRKLTTDEAPVQEEKKPRGRPRKTVAEEKVEEKVAPKKGRPKKTEQAKPASKPTASKKPATKSTAKKKTATKSTTAKKSTSSPKTTAKKATQPKTEEVKKTRGRPKKSPILGEDISSLSQISQLISEEEAKLNKMKALLNSEIDEVMKAEAEEQVDKEREELIHAVETLKAQAAGAEKSAQTEKDLASINQRLEDLIKEIAVLNNRK